VRTTFSNRKTAGQDLLAVLAHDVEEPLPPIKLALPVEFSEAPAEEVRRRPRRFGIGLTAAADDLGRRHQFVGRIGGRTVFHLVCHRAAPALDLLSPSLRSQLVDPVALITDARTEPEFRNRSIFAAGMQWTAQWARQQGIRTVATLIQIDNLPSLRAAAKAGFRRLGEVTVLR
jgi:RimJ/RimL family protein N-acetyltransferase